MTVSPVWHSLVAFAILISAAFLSACNTTPNDTEQAVEKLYADAKGDMASGNYESALKSLERVQGRAVGTLLAQQATLDMAYAYYKTGDREQTLATLERFIKFHPSSPAFDYALYLRGLANFNDTLGVFANLSRQDLSERDQQALRDAHQAFTQLIEQFPESKYASDARSRMNYIVNTLARYELHVARYYFSRGAYLAAANRAQQAVQEFQHAAATEEALYIMMQSYDKLGLTQLRDDADRVLQQNFPESELRRTNSLAKERAWWKLW